MSFDLPFAILLEITSKVRLQRTPEFELVMNAEDTVADYSKCGEESGALYGPYLYNALQISARVGEGDQVVDLGCGSGRLLNLVARWNPNTHFTGVDLAPKMLDQARQQAAVEGLTNVTYQEGDFSTLDAVGTNSVDAVISSMALHHLPDRTSLTRCFHTINRVLRPDGALYLMDFGRLRSQRALEIFVAKVARTETAALAQDYRASLHAAFTPDDFVTEIAALQRQNVSFNRTIVAPLVMIASTPLRSRRLVSSVRDAYQAALSGLSSHRRAELRELRMFLRFGGMEVPR